MQPHTSGHTTDTARRSHSKTHPMKDTPDTLNDTSADFLTRQQVAKKLSVHPMTVARMQRAGKLTPFIFGANLVRYSVSEVSALIAGAKAPATA